MDTIQSNEVENMVPQPPLARPVDTTGEILANPPSCRICFSKVVGVIKSMKIFFASFEDVVY